MKKIYILIGTRPNFIKITRFKELGSAMGMDIKIIHTGQHFDENMADVFFTQFGLQPDYFLNVGGQTPNTQIANIILKLEDLFKEQGKPDLFIVPGDVNSTIACAIAAKKKNIPVAHIEAGLRSYDWTMPEEVNRVVTDSISNYFFTTSDTATNYLIKRGFHLENIFFVGNTMIDNLNNNIHRFRKPLFWDKLKLEKKKYLLLTLHRPANVDQEDELLNILEKISSLSNNLTILFPVHPRTSNKVKKSISKIENLHLLEPQTYLEFMYLLNNSMAIITDSGGITEESTVLGVPCMTVRNNTERPETVEIGTNRIIGTNPEKFKPWFEKLYDEKWPSGQIPLKWDGKSGERIINILIDILKS